MMKIELNRWTMGLAAALIVVAGAGWVVYSQMQPNTEHQVATRSAADQELVDTIMATPERFDAVLESSEQPDPKLELPERPDTSVDVVVSDENGSETMATVNSASPISRPNMLSAVEKPLNEKRQMEPVSAENLYFWKDYSSMRQDSVSNPDSVENRAGVVALMKARQKRLGRNQ